jgi:hypothetical protein
MILYIIIWDVLSKSLYIYTYADTGIMEIDSAKGSIYLESLGVDRHHINIRNTHCIFPSSGSNALLRSFGTAMQFVWILTHSCQVFIDPRDLCGSSRLGIPVYALPLCLCFSRRNRFFPELCFGCLERCGRVLMMGCQPWSSSHHTMIE